MGCYSRVYFSTGYEYGSSMNRNDARPSRKNDDNIFELKYTFESKVFAKFSPFQEWNPLLHSAKKEFPKNFQFFFSKENFTPSKVDSKLECFRLFPFLLLPNRLFHRKKKKNRNSAAIIISMAQCNHRYPTPLLAHQRRDSPFFSL